MRTVDRARLKALIEQETARYVESHPGSLQISEKADHLLGRVPMTWMNKWAGGFPIALATANGCMITDVDGNRYVDFALGDTGAMAGHSPKATIAAVRDRLEVAGGITTMLTTDKAEFVASNLSSRFLATQWSFTLSATDANRFSCRLARQVTGRNKVLVFNYSYHGSVDETFVSLDEKGMAISRPGNVGPAVDPTTTTKVVEFNDGPGLHAALAPRDVAVVLLEPALTNIGIVLPTPEFLDAVQEACAATGTLLLVDETHTFSLGFGGAVQHYNLRPDIVVIGKAIGGGIPCGAYGVTKVLGDQIAEIAASGADIVDVGGVGGTLAGYALSLDAMAATLGEVLTESAFVKMIDLATVFCEAVEAAFVRFDAPFSVTQLGARAEYRFTRPRPTSGGAAHRAEDEDLDIYFHLFLANRGILITPFHNMALMCPDTTLEDVDHHTTVFGQALAELFQ
jgi:glutamate-1-semialdehyde 2,1-aminomutase